MDESSNPSEGALILYQTPGGAVRIEVLYESETFWLNQGKIAELFGVDIRTISYHLSKIYDSGELAHGTNSPKNLESSNRGHAPGSPRNRVLQSRRHYFRRLSGQQHPGHPVPHLGDPNPAGIRRQRLRARRRAAEAQHH